MAMPQERLPKKMYNEMMEQRRPLQSSWCSSVRRIAFKWDLGSVWESQQLPPGWNGDRWRDFLIGVAKKRATEVWHNSIAENDRRIARNYASWLHTADASHMEMAEYLRFAGIEDEGARILYALRAGASELRVDADRRHLEHSERTCRFCAGGQVEDARHVVRECTAHDAARTSLVAKLPSELKDISDDGVFSALMQGAELRRLCPSRPRRKTVITAVKSFWRSVYARRQIQN